MGKIKSDYKNLTFANDFIFAKVMRNRKLCKKLLEVILKVEIDRIEYLEEQKSIDEQYDAKSVRLDVYVKDDKNTVYNIEMQTVNTRSLAKRSRYYQGIIDMNLIVKGENYTKLNKSYIIFICLFDIFGKGRHIYTFENRCVEDLDICLGDETVKVFLNPASDMDDVDEELKNFLSYLADDIPRDAFTTELHEAVDKAKNNNEMEVEYMTMLMREQEKYDEGVEWGLERGLREIVLKMYQKHYTLEQIADILDKDVEEIEEMIK